jgi:hypothetical protein
VDASYRTPLVDCFRRGEAPRDVRLEAARGALAPRAHEQLLLLMLLVSDADAEVAAVAAATIASLPAGPLSAFLARPDVGPEVREFFAARGIGAAAAPAAARDEPSVDQPLIEQPLSAPLHPAPPAAEASTGEAPPAGAHEGSLAGDDAVPAEVRRGASQRLALMTVSERMKIAMQGTREERAILIRDPNRLVASAVLSSPKLSASEVETISKMGNVSDEVLRIVGTSRMWTKNYPVVVALTRNAKTPIAVSLTLLSRLTERDVKMLSTDRNIAEPVRLAARKIATKAIRR